MLLSINNPQTLHSDPYLLIHFESLPLLSWEDAVRTTPALTQGSIPCDKNKARVDNEENADFTCICKG